MDEIEIQDVSLPPQLSNHLWGCSVQVPLIGSGDVGFWIHVGGYVSGRWRPAAAVEFVDADRVVHVASVRFARPEIAISRPGEGGVEVCGFYTLVDARKLSPEFDLCVRAVLEDGNRVQIGSIRGRHRYHLAKNENAQDSTPPAEPVPAGGTDHEPSIPSIRDDLKGLILEALEDRGVAAHSDAADDGSQLLADVETSTADAEASLLDGIALAGKTVLELGAGMGQRARAARARGAALVDGFESDPDLVSLARLLTAYHHTSRVFFHQQDDLLHNGGGQQYDVVLASSGFDLIRDRLDVIASITSGVFVTELPSADDGRAAALESVRTRFPFHELLELSTAPGTQEQGSRLFVVCAAAEPSLRSALLAADGLAATR
jgi:SAM-dependent methyltransferase